MIGANAGGFDNAWIHFVLDGLGDLGRIPRKAPIPRANGHSGHSYIPITSSELLFCFRHWTQLKKHVFFYVNYERVVPPWTGEWRLHDLSGSYVSSSQGQWLRYAYYRQIFGRIPRALRWHSPSSHS